MRVHRIAVVPGDGIGKEVIPAGISVLNAAGELGGFRCEFTEVPWGCDYYLQTGRMMDGDGIGQLLQFDAIYLGAIGDPRVADHISARELILPLRQRLGELLTAEEVDATHHRVELMLKHRIHPYPPEDWPAIPWPPL